MLLRLPDSGDIDRVVRTDFAVPVVPLADLVRTRHRALDDDPCAPHDLFPHHE